jgi:hypothetical protein
MTDDSEEFDLTDEERAQLAALPRTAPVRASEEERTVAALRARGWLRARTPTRGRWVAAALGAAAALAVFWAGVSIGERLERTHTIEGQLQAQALDATREAGLVQRAGTAYLTALDRLGSTPVRTEESADARREGREAAHAVLRATVLGVLRLDPTDTLAARMAIALDSARAAASAAASTPGPKVIRF